MREEQFDLILLDLMLPDHVGHRGLQAASSRAPQTAADPGHHGHREGEEVDRVVGFELGADDYVVKPFSVRELILRVRAVLRRAEGPAERAGARSRSACSGSTGPRTGRGSTKARSRSRRSSSAC